MIHKDRTDPIGISARDVPVLRDEVAAHLARPVMPEWFRWAGKTLGWFGKLNYPEANSDAWYDRVRNMVRLSELFYVSNEMTALSSAAGTSMPSFALAREDLPAESGLMVFDAPIGVWSDDTNQRRAFVVAAGWGVDAHLDDGGGPLEAVSIVFYTWRDANLDSAVSFGEMTREAAGQLSGMPRLVYDNECMIRLGEEHHFPGDGSIIDTYGRTVLAAWLLMMQPGVAETKPYKYAQTDRAWLKRHRHQPDLIRVVRLRYALATGHPAEGVSRNYQHRWYVRGHWRRQWYPSRNDHLPIWISPHIKGPDGAPLLAGEVVNAFVR